MYERLFNSIPRNVCGIYKIINNKTKEIYIGQSIDIRRRLASHVSVANRIKEGRCLEREKLSPIDMALSKNDLSNFTWSIIEVCKINELDEKEKYWINYYNSYSDGYNATLGGQAWIREVPECIHNIKHLLRDTDLDLQTIANQTGITYQIVSNINRGICYKEDDWPMPIRPVNKKVIQYDKYGNEIARYGSVTEAAEAVNTSSTRISSACKKEGDSAKGFIWRYENDPITMRGPLTVHNSKIVIQLDKQGNEICRYASLQDAANAIGCKTKDHIGRACRGERATYKGYVWKYLDD